MSEPFTPPSYRNAPDVIWTTADLCDQALQDPGLGLRVLPPVYRSFGGRPWYFGQVQAARAAQPDGALSLAALLSEPGRNRVLVVDGGASLAHAVLGDRMAAMAVQNGWSGVLVHGCVRDVHALGRMPVGIHALAAVPNRPSAMPPAIAADRLDLHGIAVRTGDWLYADDDGIIVLSRRHTDGDGTAD
ncbi:ribonuclease E activity regulator RraA [Bordetella genomosp. 13]|uniref:4-hydroxy-4-methyl-2-oxoglutarate aldolase n=1 Tax=Bordetella genomosp. 13 TaxID=463040 RepID=A0A1W6Z724_9BORD|nr:ribonuclease E activity regulator RraA [Bordetella genomosp. 13]ARP93188.1 hypothetical protein CAL15_01570 [Bordetella genomosp. 13]